MLKKLQVDFIDRAQETDIKRCDLNIILRKLTPADILSSDSKKDSLFKTGKYQDQCPQILFSIKNQTMRKSFKN